MTEEHEWHLKKLKDDFCAMVDKKYRAGQAEHKGKLWEKEDILDEALAEVLDLWVYLKTEKDKRHADPRV